MFNRQLFILAHQVGDRNFYPTYKKLIQNQWKSYKELKEEQDKRLRHIINYAYKNVPYYHNLFVTLKLLPEDIKKIEDLQKLPILTKDIIKLNWNDLKPINLNNMKYYEMTTGGSTGIPLNYRLSNYNRFLGGALLYRGWGYGDYSLGDKMIFLAGTSLNVGMQPYLTKLLHERIRNIRKLSALDMGDKEMREYVDKINSFKPKFIRGYASSIYFFSKWLEENNIEMNSIEAVFTTAEKLYPYMRKNIGDIFGCNVYDNYGLNDGQVSAFECSENSGLHIDTERAIMEIVGTDGNQTNYGEGKILATSLHDYSMPFIRYETGDIGYLADDICSCSRGYKLMKEIIGRGQEFLVDPIGRRIHGAAFYTYIMENLSFINKIKEIQVVQKYHGKVILKIVSINNFDESQLFKVRDIVHKRFNGMDIEFKFVDHIERKKNNKYNFIINELTKNNKI